MTDILTCRVTQLLYAEAPLLNFAQLVADVQDMLVELGVPTPALTWDYDDIALLDFNTGRIVVGFTDNLKGSFAACLTFAAGHSPQWTTNSLTSADQDRLCQQLTLAFALRFPSDAQQSEIIAQPLTPDLIDQVVDRLFQEDANQPAQTGNGATNSEPVDASSAVSEMDRLMRRLSSELVSRTPNVITKAIAQVTPHGRASGDPAAIGGGQEKTPHTKSAPSFGQEQPPFPSSLFWRNGKALQSSPKADARKPSKSPAKSDELKAVRDALYAADQSTTLGTGRRLQISAQASAAMQALAGLPGVIASSIAGLRRVEGHRIRS